MRKRTLSWHLSLTVALFSQMLSAEGFTPKAAAVATMVLVVATLMFGIIALGEWLFDRLFKSAEGFHRNAHRYQWMKEHDVIIVIDDEAFACNDETIDARMATKAVQT